MYRYRFDTYLIQSFSCFPQEASQKVSPVFFANFYISEGLRMKASIAIQVLPDAANDEELIRIVDEVIAYIKSTGLHCHVGPFETTIEGEDYDQLMDIAKECQHVAIRAGAKHVSAYIKVVYQPEGEVLTIDRKITKHAEA